MSASAPLERLIVRLRVLDRLADAALGLVHRHGIVRDDLRTGRQQFLDEHERRRFAHVVRVRLEGETPDRDTLALHVRQAARDLLEQAMLLRVVRRLNGVEHTQGDVVGLRRANERLHVLRKARAANLQAQLPRNTCAKQACCARADDRNVK